MRTRRRILLLTTTVSMMVAAVAAFTAPADAASHASRFHLAGDVKGVSITAESDYADGTALVTYDRNGTPYSASGPNGSIITFSTTGMTLTMPPTLNSDGTKVLGKKGVSQATSAFLAQQNGPTMTTFAPSDSSILASPCITPAGWGGRFCDVITLVQQNGQDWYVGDQLSATANNIAGISGSISRGSGNSLVSWDPTSVINPSSCTSYSLQATAPSGAGVGGSWTLCPDRITPSVSALSFGVTWGHNGNTTGGFHAVDVFHNPPGYPWGISMNSTSIHFPTP